MSKTLEESTSENQQPEDFLSTAHRLIRGARQNDYGDKRKNFTDIARMWSVILGKDIDAHHVAQCMIAMKLARLIKSPSHKDSWIDIAGYVGCAEDLFDEDEWK